MTIDFTSAHFALFCNLSMMATTKDMNARLHLSSSIILLQNLQHCVYLTIFQYSSSPFDRWSWTARSVQHSQFSPSYYTLQSCVSQKQFFFYSSLLHFTFELLSTHSSSASVIRHDTHSWLQRFYLQKKKMTVKRHDRTENPWLIVHLMMSRLHFSFADQLCIGPATLHDLISFSILFFFFLFQRFFCLLGILFASSICQIWLGFMDIPSLSFSWSCQPSLPPRWVEECLVPGITFRCRYDLYD